ncbi:PREDICTED: F-box protein At5g41720-like [Camelina sativa]|uniref:F-box protein At5g41720-like n=1 Tax=Camelina sativa TaxID=90675 RepID=A0ABM1RKL6_CAMSA|nr:PREDICTED: F-box protein At5g41720-like [Camelina sativa]
MIPAMMNENVPDKWRTPTFSQFSFRRKSVSKVPQNVQVGDYGVYALKNNPLKGFIWPHAMLNQDVIQEILSHCSATEIARFRLQNKECNKRSYELRFIDHHLHRANSVFGYFVHYEDKWFRYRPRFVPSVEAEQEEKGDKKQISLQFLPQNNAKIKACDTHHGILICIGDRFKGAKMIPDYIVCKPATKQFRIIPNPKTRYLTITTGLMVISLNPFRYKIIRVSEPRTWMTKEGFYIHNR